MARSFTEREKENIRGHLLEACKQSWTQYGYKKTSVDKLCRQAGISKGAFYLFFESKEALFCAVLCAVQNKICADAQKIMDRQPDVAGVAEALKQIYRAYDQNDFLCHGDSADYIVLMNKLSGEQVEKLQEAEAMSRQLFLDRPGLPLKVDADMALSVIYSLLMTIKNKKILPHDHGETFDFMVDHLIHSLYGGECT